VTNTAGIPLVELFDITDRISNVLPQQIQDFIDRFSATGLESLTSPASIIHTGRLQPLAPVFGSDVTEIDLGIGSLSLPLLHSGVPFQLALIRGTPAAGDNLEPAASGWRLDLSLAEFIFTFYGLESATFVKETGTTPRHLLRDPVPVPVRIIGSATLRLQKLNAAADVQMLFVDSPDPIDPSAPTGAVAELVFSPPHFFLGSSEVGLTVGRLLFDASDTFSPPQVLERGQGPGWVGMMIEEATVYAPRNLPVIGDLSGGIKNVLFGQPMGIQGEFELQFGRTALDPATFQFFQEPGATPLAISGSGQSRLVQLTGNPDEPTLIRCGFTLPAPPGGGTLVEWKAKWRFPDVGVQEGDNAEGLISHGQVLKVQPVEVITENGQTQESNHPEIAFRFVALGAIPSIRATVNGTDVDDVIHLAGTPDDIGAVALTAVSSAPGTSEFTWEILGTDRAGSGSTYQPDFSGMVNGWTIRLSERVAGESTARTAHLAITLVEQGRLLIGSVSGVSEGAAPGVALPLTAAEATFALSDFHARGQFTPLPDLATLDPGSPTGVDVQPDQFARVVVSEGGAPPVFDYDRHVQILMAFEQDTVLGWGDLRPAGVTSTPSDAASVQEQLLAWAANYPNAEFLVIGRCDDVGSGGNQSPVSETPDAFNIQLAKDRAARGRSLFTTREPGATAGALIPGARIFTRGETSAWDSGSAAGDTKEERPDIALDPAEKSESRSNASLANGWLIKHLFAGQHEGWANRENADPTSEGIRRKYRRVDIYAVTDAVPLAGAQRRTLSPAVDATLRRSYIPNSNRTPLPAPVGEPAIDYWVKLVVGWDNPTAVGFQDAVPSIIEAEFAWSPTTAPLPPVGGGPVDIDREVLTVYAKWVHDSRTGFTRATLGIKSDGDPNGLFHTEQPNLTMAAAIGPMLLSGVDVNNDMVGSGARIAALVAATAVAGINFGGGGPLVGAGSKVAFMKLEAEAQTRALSDIGADYQLELTTDYVCTLHIDGGVLGIKTDADHPVKIRYKDVGISYDNTQTGWDKIGLAYATDSMEIEDPGKWEISGALGDLLRIVEVSMGRGSLWVEMRVAAALDLGVVEVTEAIFRLTWETGNPVPSFELRGFTVNLDVAEVVSGQGRLRIEDGGVIRAGVDANVVPLGIGVQAGLAMGRPPSIAPSIFLELFLGVQFSTPLPLAQSGAAIYGFKGMFVANGERKLGSNPDPVGRELDWWQAPPGNKYQPRKDQYAIGVGVVVGTMPDVSFCFSAGGMLVVGFPDLEVVLGVDVEIISVPDTTATDEGGSSGTITGLIVINDEGVKVAVAAQYTIPKLLELRIPFAAYFPASLRGSYVRLGSDGQTAHGRYGEPVTLKLLPDTLNVEVWAYMMVEQDGLPSLGGDPRFSFEGFSVGFGAGWGIDWSAGPISLTASAKVLVGFGTNPLLIKGGVFVNGKLDLVVVSIAARGELILTYFQDAVYLTGEFCGEVDLFFFSLKGCVGVEIGSASVPAPPPPEPPIVSISLTDRRDRVMGEAAPIASPIAARALFDLTSGANDGVPPKENNTVWADTAPVLHFRHAITENDAQNQFAIPALPAAAEWFGSNRLKYAYRLDRLILREKGGPIVASTTANPLQAVWMSTPYRQPDASGSGGNPVPSEHEGPNLKLLDWNPWNWAVNLEDGGAGSDGNPATTAGNLCETVPTPRRACVFGENATAHGLYGARMAPDGPPQPPYPSRFIAFGEPRFRTPLGDLAGRDLQSFALLAGRTLEGGGIVPTSMPIPLPGRTVTAGVQLPWLWHTVPGGTEETALPYEVRFDRALSNPSITLLVCDAPGRPGGAGKRCHQFDDLRPSGKAVTVQTGGYTIRSINPQRPFILVDQIDARIDPARSGSDGSTDIAIHDAGIVIVPDTPATQFELHFFSERAQTFEVRAFNAAGRSVDSVTASAQTGRPLSVQLTGIDGIARLDVRGAMGGLWLYRICRIGDRPTEQPPAGTGHRCVRFASQPPQGGGVTIQEDWLTLTALDPQHPLRLVDAVDQNGPQPVKGRDGTGEPMLPDRGAQLTLKGCVRLELGFLRQNGAPVKIVGLSADGKTVAKALADGPQGTPEFVILESRTGAPITTVRIQGGAGEAVLFRVCCLDDKPEKQCVDFRQQPIDRDVAVVDLGDVTVRPMVQAEQLRLVDAVDQTRDPARPGRDQGAEIMIPHGGVVVTLTPGSLMVELALMLFAGPVKATGFDASGTPVAAAASTSQQGVPQILTLTASTPIVRITIEGGQGEAVLYWICRSGSDASPQRNCITFAGIDLPRGIGKFTHRELVFVDPSGRGSLVLMDNVAGAVPGNDGIPELYFGSDVLEINLPAPVDAISIGIMLFAGPVKGSAYDVAGTRVSTAKTTTTQNSVQTLNFSGPGIVRIELSGGDGKAAIIEICRKVEATQPRVLPGSISQLFAHPGIALRAAAAATAQDVVVHGIKGEAIDAVWAGRVIRRVGNCRVIEYRPPAGTDSWNGAQIIAPTGKRVTLLSVCGTDFIQVQRAADDQAHRNDLLGQLTNTLTTPPQQRRELLLQPGQAYEIEAQWSWAVWQSNEDATNSPDPIAALPASEFTAGTAQVFHFAVATESTVTGLTQDGLNEHVFDPRDIARYVALVEPADGRSAQFTDDPIWVHFSAGHVEALLAAYERKVDIRVARTDPPPQASEADLLAILLPLAPLSQLATAFPAQLSPTAWTLIDEALAEAPCVPDVPFGDGVSIATRFALEPLAMYDLAVTAPRTDGTDPMTVWPTRFVTSRYSGPAALVADLGLATPGPAPFRPAEILIDPAAVIPGGGLEVSDQQLGALLAAIGADTLPLPTRRPETYVVWRQVGTNWQIEGVLVDSLESLNRTGAVLINPGQPDERADIGTRFKLESATIAGTSLTVHRATENWTRVFLKPAAPIVLPPGDHSLSFAFTASDGNIIASRSLSSRPAMLDREGL
jgi:hypothetical protein